jgi:CheY-like chemotaxis protein
MTESDLGRIFEAFTQGENTRAVGVHPFGGLGLGLAISRMLVESHSGKGTTLMVSLPLSTQRAVAHRSPEPARTSAPVSRNGTAASIRILLVEDHEPTRIALTQLLTRRHCEVKTAASLLEARALSQEQSFQLLISDIGLPDGSGLELIKELRARHEGLRGIALTGYGMEQDIARSQEAGFTVHLTKPVRVQSLENALARAIEAASLPEMPVTDNQIQPEEG